MTKPIKGVCAQRRLRSAGASTQSDQSSMSAWRNLGSLAFHWAHSEDSDQTGRMPRLIRVFPGRTLILLVLSCCSSFYHTVMCTKDADRSGQTVSTLFAHYRNRMLSQRMTKPTKWHAPSKDSDQPGHPPSLIRVFVVPMKKLWILRYPVSAQRRLWSDCANAQADLSSQGSYIILLVLSCSGSVERDEKTIKLVKIRSPMSIFSIGAMLICQVQSFNTKWNKTTEIWNSA